MDAKVFSEDACILFMGALKSDLAEKALDERKGRRLMIS